MSYRLKKGQEAFQVVDGPFAKRRYRQGIEYRDADIPPRERHKFEKAPEKVGGSLRSRSEAKTKKPQASNLKPQT